MFDFIIYFESIINFEVFAFAIDFKVYFFKKFKSLSLKNFKNDILILLFLHVIHTIH